MGSAAPTVAPTWPEDGKKGEAAPVEYKFAQKPVVKEGWEGFAQFVWNSETSEFLGRTGLSWLKIGLFYIIYYACLAGFFIVMLLIFYQTLDDHHPKWQNSNGLIGSNPGVGFRPRPSNDHIESTLIWFRSGTIESNGNWDKWVKRYNEEFLNDYYKDENYTKITFKDRRGKATNKRDCSIPKDPTDSRTQLCAIMRDPLFKGDCTPQNNYGWKEGKPCIAIKLNKIYGWVPEPYDEKMDEGEYINRPPSDFPKALNKTYYDNVQKGKFEDNRKVWIECHGQNPADVENMGEVVYYPEPALSPAFYPYENQVKYLSPIVFMQMKKPVKAVMIAIECKAWAKNIKHNSQERRGLAQFEVMID